MDTILLQTKLFIPPLRQNHILRPRLVNRLNENLPYKLILLSAPAGYGKTTLTIEWIKRERSGSAVYWLSLDEDDNDTQRFFSYLDAALQPSDREQNSLAQLLQVQHPSPAKHLMAAFVNDIATTAVSSPIYLILDDYHAIDSVEIDEAIAFLLDHSPPQLTLILTSRTDPGFPISRLRARGEMLELRAPDLRFTQAEAADFLQQTMNLTITPAQITALETRTEGWIAGLQMAALSMQNRHDIGTFIDSFTGSHRFIMDYLLEEVLNQQTAETEAFLLETAVLDRFCADLCDAVRQTAASSQTILQQLDAENLFLIPLDHERRWYRYHHLFAEILRQRLHQKGSASTKLELHQRASRWYEAQQLEIEAFYHATASGDIDRAAQLINGNGVPLYLRGGGTLVLNWFASLPPEMLETQPSLLVAYGSALTYVGKSKEAETRLKKAEIQLENIEKPDVRDRDLIGQIAALNAMKEITHNDFKAIIRHADRALTHLRPDNQTARTTAVWALGYAYQVQGKRTDALQAYQEVLAISKATANETFLMGALVSLGQIQEAENQLIMAAENYREVLHIAGDPPAAPACEAHRGLAYIYHQWNEQEKAIFHAQAGYDIAITIESIDTPATCQMLLARILLAQGDIAGAAKLSAEAKRFILKHQFTHELPNWAATQLLIHLRQNQIAEAAELAITYDLPISRARVHLAQGDPTAALEQLTSYRQVVEAKQWADEWLKILIVQAIAHQAGGETSAAIQRLHEAILMAETNHLIQIFVDEGQQLAQLLTAVPSSHYVSILQAAFTAAAPTPSSTPPPHSLIDPLSERELEIISYIARGLKNKEIAAKLFISINTIHYHTKNIYGKLEVNNRTQAIAKATELKLI